MPLVGDRSGSDRSECARLRRPLKQKLCGRRPAPLWLPAGISRTRCTGDGFRCATDVACQPRCSDDVTFHGCGISADSMKSPHCVSLCRAASTTSRLLWRLRWQVPSALLMHAHCIFLYIRRAADRAADVLTCPRCICCPQPFPRGFQPSSQRAWRSAQGTQRAWLAPVFTAPEPRYGIREKPLSL